MTKIDHCVIYITKKCNLRCAYCFVRNRSQALGSMTKSTAEKTIDFLLGPISKKNLNLSFFGGEPLVEYKFLKDIIKYAFYQSHLKNKRVTFSVVTNGTLVNQEVLNFFDKYRVKLILSCDGNHKSQNKHRVFPDGSGSFKILNKKIRDIAKLKNSCTRITFTSDTMDRIFENVSYLYNAGFRNIGCSPIDQKDWTDREIKIIKRELEKVGRFWLQKHRNGEKLHISPLVDYFELIENPRQNFYVHMHKCWAGKWGLSIDINGEIYSCHRFVGIKKFILGNVSSKKINNNIRKQFLEKPINSVGCMGINYHFRGNIKKTPPGPKKICNTFLKVAKEIYKKL